MKTLNLLKKGSCLDSARFFGLLLVCCVPISVAAVNVLTGICLLFWLFSKLTKKSTGWHSFNNQITIAISLFLLICCIGIFYSSASTVDALHIVRKMSRLLLIPVFFDLYAGSKKWQSAVIKTFLLSNVLTAGMSILLGGETIQISSLYKYSNISPFKDTIFFSMLNSFCAFFCITTLYYSHSYINKFLHAGLVIGFSYCTLITGIGRTGQVIFFCLLALFYLQNFKFIKKIFYYTICLVTIITTLFVHGNNGFVQRNTEAYNQFIEYKNYFIASSASSASSAPPYTSIGLRMNFVNDSLKLIKKHWIFGNGTGSFMGEYKKNFRYHITSNPHNQYIFTLVELGLLGLFALLFIIYALWKFSYSLPKLEKNLLQGVIATIFIGSLANSWLNDFTSMYFLVTMAGVLMAARSNLPTHISHLD